MNADELVTVHLTADPIEAELVQNALRSEGIHCEIEGETQAGLAGVLDIKVLVKAWDESKARKIIESHHHGDDS